GVAAVAATGGGVWALDAAAAPGGKATALAARGATVIAADLQPQRVQLIARNVEVVAASTVFPVVADATTSPFAAASFDHVLVDAPCSGLGTLRRRPDARWRVQRSDVAELSV
ncbi:MAG TPA: rRNA cytosine-C5-methyltransferase, partial [Acidimicrobiaceae bacterium]|nr:rRNA cytosine-C5-methyltransferase [Acidimicrobiaceae bacterium]